ncbi:MAG: folate-binding protein YgfZ [Planctomycetales bacterium]|nr:folate-binding protein YgfZ [Planctomycetales bacterium]
MSSSDGFPDEAASHFYAMRNTCALVAFERRTQIDLTGSDRQRFLHNLCTNDVSKLTPGQGCEAFATNVQGKCIGHVLISCQENLLRVSTVADQASVLIPHWDRYLITEDVELIDRSAQRGEILLAGPASTTVLSRLGVTAPDANLANTRLTIEELDCWVTRTPMVGVDNFLLSYPLSAGSQITSLLLNAGAVTSDPTAAWLAFEAARLEHGFPWFGRDISDKNLPQEVQRDAQAISFTKGCYLGQETVARIDALGHVNRVLRRLRCESPTLPPDGTPVHAADKPVGEITSAAYSPSVGSAIALAYLRCEHAAAETVVELPTGSAVVLPVA